MAICYIVGAAAFCAPFEPGEEDLVIAADGGLLHLRVRGIVPDLVVGDFDSLDKPPVGDNVAVYPVEKDDTDTMLALKLGWERGFRTFHLLAGTGGRTDHTLANLQALLWLAARGGRGVLCGEEECFTAVKNDTITFRSEAAGTLSVFAQSGTARGVTLTGTYYGLDNATLSEEFPLGVSNHFTGEVATVSVADGSLLVYWSGIPSDILE